MTSATNELKLFQEYLSELIAQGRIALLPEEALDQWRIDHPLLEEDYPLDDDLDDVKAVQLALADRLAGDRGRSLDHVMDEVCCEHGLVNPRS